MRVLPKVGLHVMSVFQSVLSIPSQLLDPFRGLSSPKLSEAKTMRFSVLAFKAVGCCLMYGALSGFMGSGIIMKVVRLALFILGHDITVAAENQYKIFRSYFAIPDFNAKLNELKAKVLQALIASGFKLSVIVSAVTNSEEVTEQQIKQNVRNELSDKLDSTPEEQKPIVGLLIDLFNDVISSMSRDQLRSDGFADQCIQQMNRSSRSKMQEALSKGTLVFSPLVQYDEGFLGSITRVFLDSWLGGSFLQFRQADEAET